MSIMKITKVVLRSVLSRPATRLYPFVKRPFFKNTRGHIFIDIEKCIFCGICQKKCPSDAILVTKASKEWQIDRLKCISCSACVEACPKKCLSMENEYSSAVIKKDDVDKFKQKEKPTEEINQQ